MKSYRHILICNRAHSAHACARAVHFGLKICAGLVKRRFSRPIHGCMQRVKRNRDSPTSARRSITIPQQLLLPRRTPAAHQTARYPTDEPYRPAASVCPMGCPTHNDQNMLACAVCAGTSDGSGASIRLRHISHIDACMCST